MTRERSRFSVVTMRQATQSFSKEEAQCSRFALISADMMLLTKGDHDH